MVCILSSAGGHDSEACSASDCFLKAVMKGERDACSRDWEAGDGVMLFGDQRTGDRAAKLCVLCSVAEGGRRSDIADRDLLTSERCVV